MVAMTVFFKFAAYKKKMMEQPSASASARTAGASSNGSEKSPTELSMSQDDTMSNKAEAVPDDYAQGVITL
jgi:hypothetical protein